MFGLNVKNYEKIIIPTGDNPDTGSPVVTRQGFITGFSTGQGDDEAG
jgi:hypothetical protein